MKTVSGFLSQMSFWIFVIGITLLLMRGMGPPGSKSINKIKFLEVRRETEHKLKTAGDAPFKERLLLYAGKYFFSYFYYRIDLIFYFFIGGALLLKFISTWME